MTTAPSVPTTTAGLTHSAALLDPNIYNQGQQLLMRWNIAISMSSLMGQDYVIMLLEKIFNKPWDNGKLWIEWHKTNEAHMKRYRFFRQQLQVEHEGHKILVFSGLDTTCIWFVLEKLAEEPEKEKFKPLKEFRNVTAHGTKMEMTPQEFEDGFAQLFQIVQDMFQSIAPIAEKWVCKLEKIKNSPIQDPAIEEMVEKLENVQSFQSDMLCQQQDMLSQQQDMLTKQDDMLLQQDDILSQQHEILNKQDGLQSQQHVMLLHQQETQSELYRLKERLEEIHNAVRTKPTVTSPQSSMRDLEIEFAKHLKEHVQTHLSSIPIPASSFHMDLEETVLNQSMHRVLSEAARGQVEREATDREETTNASGSQSYSPKEDSWKKNATQTSSEPVVAQPNVDSFVNNEPDLESDRKIDDYVFEPDREIDDYQSDSSDSSSTSSLNFVQILFNEMRDVIEREIRRGNQRILITAAGGRGKTTAAKKLMHLWGKSECLHQFFAVIRLDVKLLDMSKDLFENLLLQYPFLESLYSKEGLEKIREMYRTCQEKVFWILDGLDESPSHHLTQRFLERNEQLYPRSVIMILTRDEGKKILDLMSTSRAEFAMNNLTTEQCELFMEKFPFSGKNATKKRSSLLQAWKDNQVIKSVFPIPINAAMICRLFDEDNFHGSFKDELEIFEAILAMNVKAALLKSIEIEIDTSLSAEQVRKLSKDKQRIMETNPLKILKEKIQLLVKLGHAIFICNGNSLIGFQNIEEASLKEALKQLDVTDDEVEFLHRLDFFERKLVGSVWMIQFFHRNFRELVVSLYPSHTTAQLEIQTQQGRLKDAHLSVFRCTLALIQKHEDKASSQQKIINVIQQILGSCITADEWRLVQMVCETIHTGRAMSEQAMMLKDVLQCIIQLVNQKGFSLDNKLKQTMSTKLITAIYLHAEDGCENCHLPTGLKQKAKEFFEQKLDETFAMSWPDIKPFRLCPFLAKDKEFVVFCLPGTGSVMAMLPHNKNHVKTCSTVIHYRKPQAKDLIRLPLPPPRLIPSPVAFEYNWKSSVGFPGGRGFVAHCIKNQILVWGGEQKQKDGTRSVLPINSVHSYDIRTKSWSSTPAQGQIPSFSVNNSSVAKDNIIYISGGTYISTHDFHLLPSHMTNALSTLNVEGVFEKVRIKGAKPSPRFGHVSWMYKNAIYLGFGVKVEDEGTGFIPGGDGLPVGNKIERTNQIVKFDVREQTYIDFPTTGSRPKPRTSFGATRLESKVFIHGGLSRGETLSDFHVLNMRTSQWSELRDFGLPRGASGQSLTALPPHQIFLLGGGQHETQIFDKVMIFNDKDSTWREDQSLPKDFCENGGRLRRHQAVPVKNGNRVTKIICIGSLIGNHHHHPSHTLEFDISQ